MVPTNDRLDMRKAGKIRLVHYYGPKDLPADVVGLNGKLFLEK